MKFKLLLILCFCSVLASNTMACAAEIPRYSPFWRPISTKQTQVEVRRNANDALRLYQLWWQARMNDSVWYYVVTLREVTQKQPQNAPALAVYSLVLLDCRDYASSPNYKRAQADFGEDLQIPGIRSIIDKAKKLDPKQWPVWLAESRIVPFESGQLNSIGKETEDFARRAVALNNNSFTNNELSYALLKRSVWDNDKGYIERAIKVAKRAQSLAPTNPMPGVLLVEIYSNYSKDADARKNAAQTVLATIPGNSKLSAGAKTFLKQKGIR
ncbi:hypothetical protein EON80_13085 [bacterium]|nr:MAG: hypothetical protein EON80_13085 [bacterium]